MAAYVYIDSNVVSYIAAGRLRDFIDTLKSSGTLCIVSELVLDEVSKGSPNGELELLKRHGTLFISAREPLVLGQAMSAKDISEYQSEDTSFAEIDDFLLSMIVALTGNPTADISFAALRQALSNLADRTFEKNSVEPWIETAFRAALDEQLRTVSETTPPVISKDALTKFGIGRKFFTHLRPPSLIRKIVNQVSRSSTGALEMLEKACFAPISPNDNVRERIHEAGMCLILWGFGRDRKIDKLSSAISVNGARSQERDLLHIAAAAGLSGFVSADKDCARLAYALFEHFGIKTSVIFVSLAAKSPRFEIVGENFCP